MITYLSTFWSSEFSSFQLSIITHSYIVQTICCRAEHFSNIKQEEGRYRSPVNTATIISRLNDRFQSVTPLKIDTRPRICDLPLLPFPWLFFRFTRSLQHEIRSVFPLFISFCRPNKKAACRAVGSWCIQSVKSIYLRFKDMVDFFF